MLIGLGVGLLLGVLAALLLELLDDSIRTQQDLVRLAGADVPVLGTIPPTRSRDAGRGGARATGVSGCRGVSVAAHGGALRGGRPRAGASRSRRHARETGRRRRPPISRRRPRRWENARLSSTATCAFRVSTTSSAVPNDTGFTSLVSGKRHMGSLRPAEGNDRLFVLPTGPVPPKPAELFASSRSHELLGELHADDTLVIVDTPPLLLATDTVALAPALGGILLVATARVTRRRSCGRRSSCSARSTHRCSGWCSSPPPMPRPAASVRSEPAGAPPGRSLAEAERSARRPSTRRRPHPTGRRRPSRAAHHMVGAERGDP